MVEDTGVPGENQRPVANTDEMILYFEDLCLYMFFVQLVSTQTCDLYVLHSILLFIPFLIIPFQFALSETEIATSSL